MDKQCGRLGLPRGGEGSPHVDIQFLIVNIINFEKVDKPKEVLGPDNVDKVTLFFKLFFGHFNTYLVVFSLYLAIIKKKN